MPVFFLLFLLFPFLELALLIKVGTAIGVLPTLLLIVGSAILGSLLLRVAGLATALRAEPLPGGREKTLYISLDDGVLTLRRSIAGARYRASGVCTEQISVGVMPYSK